MPPVPLNSNITFKNQKLPLMHVLNALNVYLHHSKGSKQLVTFSFADYVVQYFEEHTTQYGMDYQLPLIKPLLSFVWIMVLLWRVQPRDTNSVGIGKRPAIE
ncbi:hypothetical protein QOT17_018659 [Balamuthia mandrillaris]